MNEPSEFYKDQFWPGWRKQEAKMRELFNSCPTRKEVFEIRRKATPCGECHLQPGERCDICGALAPT